MTGRVALNAGELAWSFKDSVFSGEVVDVPGRASPHISVQVKFPHDIESINGGGKMQPFAEGSTLYVRTKLRKFSVELTFKPLASPEVSHWSL